MNCPVCNTTELSEDTTSCPHCHSDLEVFRLIVDASDHRQKQKKIISALGLFAAVTAIGWASVGIFSGNTPPPAGEPVELSPVVAIQGESRPAPPDADLVLMLRKEIEGLKAENAALSSKKNTVSEKPAVKAAASQGTTTDLIHTVRNGDTFWIIAKKYYKDGRKYKQIAKDNNMTTKQKLQKGMKLKINNVNN